MIAIMFLLVAAVIATASGVLIWFFRRLNLIEEDLWGTKRKEAAATAEAEEPEPSSETADPAGNRGS